MKVDKARKLTAKANKNIQYFISPYLKDRITRAASRGSDHVLLRDGNWVYSDIALLNKLGYKTVVVPRWALIGTIAVDLLVCW